MSEAGPNAQQKLQREFWNLMRKRFAEAGTNLKVGDTDYGDWIYCRTEVPMNRLRVYLYPLKRKFRVMAHQDGRKANPNYSRQWLRYMLTNRSEIETAVGARLEWNNKPDAVEMVIYKEFDMGGFSDRDRWPGLIGVMRHQFKVFKSAFEPHMFAFAEAHGRLHADGSVSPVR